MRTQWHKRRLSSLKRLLEKEQLDALLVTDETNVRYLSGFTGGDSLLVVTQGRDYFVTDSRYAEDAADEIRGFDIKIVKESTYSALRDLIRAGRLKCVGFESTNLPYEIASKMKGVMRPSRLIPVKGMVEGLRAIKDESEIRLIKAAVRLTKKVLRDTVNKVRPGIAENFLAAEVELGFLKSGGHAGFEPIVASGANSSKPHARTTAKKIANNSFIKIDIGCTLRGYNSDITRMVVLGRPKEKFIRMYRAVRAAQRLAISMVRPDIKMSEIDRSARECIEKAGFAGLFTHSLGHGVGLDVHEEPSISSRSEGVLKPGMVFTIEPAVYIPGFGGVRIEDMVLVTNKGCEVFTA